MNDNSEVHLFILWENALYKKDEILTDIKEKFKIIKIYKIKWSNEYFLSNLSRFYGTNLPDCEAKAAHCGKGDFLLIIVRDENPIYGERNTSKGIKVLNTNMFDCKEKFRSLTGGGHKVHATNDEVETNHDITLLLNTSLEDFLKQNNEQWDEKVEEISKDLFGYNGWADVQEMFYALNNCTKYAILRNYESLPEEIYVNKHNDIDLICESKENCAYVLNAEKVFPEEYRIHYRAKVEDKYANFDLRYLGDNYYCEKLERNILENRVYNEKGFYTLNLDDYYYTLLYHALIHKKIFKPDYKTRLIKMKENKISENTNLDDMIKILKKWLENNKYFITFPDDKSVDFNIENANKFKPLLEVEIPNEKTKTFNANIIRWYPFEKLSKIMLVGENEETERYLKSITENLTVISRFENISENIEKNTFNYILIYGIEKYDDIISTLVNYLSEDGKLIIVGNNSFGIKNWCKYSKKTSINRLENLYLKNINIKQIKDELNKSGINNTNIFYAFPNYQEAELIVNEKFDLQKSHLEKYNSDINENEIKIFDEIKVLKNIIENTPEALGLFANSFLIETSKSEIKTDIKYISYNNCRNEKYRLITLIKDNVVQKIPANDMATEQIEQMKKTINNIKENNINLLDYEENDIICSKLIKNEKILDEYLNQNYNKLDNVVDILNKMKEVLLKNTLKYEECKEKIDLKGQDEQLLANLHFMKNGFWDMIAKNCFYIDNQFTFFDQEWEKEYLPVEFLIYRSIINSYDLVRKINVDELLEKLNILQYKEYFEKIDEDIRKEVINEELYKEMYCKEIKGIDNFINENKAYEEYIKTLKKDIIGPLQEDNRKKQEYILALEEKNRINEEKLRKIFFWKR